MIVTELQGITRVRFHAGQLEEFKRLAGQCLDVIRAKDSGTLQYDVHINDDQTECVFIERFRDSDALLEHNANLGDLLGEMLSTGTVVSAELFGNPSDELRERFAGAPVGYFTPLVSL